VHLLIDLLLIAALVGSTGVLVALLAAQRRRSGRRSRQSHELAMGFAPEDPFDLPCRYARFALLGRGHGLRAHDVTHGRCGGYRARCFEVGLEQGHGPRRVIRRASAVALETDLDLGEALLWHDRDAEGRELFLSATAEQAGPWRCCGPAQAVGALAGACGLSGGAGASIEVRGGVLLLWVPHLAADTAAWLAEAARAVAALAGPAEDEPAGSPPLQSADLPDTRSAGAGPAAAPEWE
jgi:hypothetical protein